MRSIKLYKCETCGNIVLVLQDSNNPLTCCETPMKLLEPNTNDAAPEKHVPYLKSKVKDCKLLDTAIYEVQIGQIEHPMLPEHYINWIGSFDNESWVIKWLRPGQKPKKNLKVGKYSSVYEYCNLHGLWKK